MSQICLTTADSITLELAGAVSANQPEFIASYIDTTTDAPSSTKGVLNNTSAVTAAAAPAGDQRLVYRLDVCNLDTAAVTVIAKVAGGTARTIIRISLSAGESMNLLGAEKGPKGDTGETGETGETGAAGPGVPNGGTANQILNKIDGTNQNTQWTGLSALLDLLGE